MTAFGVARGVGVVARTADGRVVVVRDLGFEQVPTLNPFMALGPTSRHHAEKLGRLFRRDAEPLLPNWLHLPVRYHGRSGAVVVSGTPVRRPVGLVRGPDGVVRRRRARPCTPTTPTATCSAWCS